MLATVTDCLKAPRLHAGWHLAEAHKHGDQAIASSPKTLLFAQAEASAVAEIRRRYGDHLYAKHDYDAAMAQYVATIGFMEPSYVIRKFLDAQRIHNLTSYLEELHSQAKSNL